MSENIAITKNLTKIYDKRIVIDNVNMTIKKGDIYGLVGKNGAGKTTIIKMLLSLTNSTSGEIELFGTSDLDEKIKLHSKIGSIVESPKFYKTLTARENLEYYRILKGIPGKECIDETLKLVGLSDVDKKKFNKFSLGMKQRLGLALAILGSPDFLILDEPINGLDPMGIKEVREILLNLNKMKNTTILISSHILGELSQIANCYGFLNNGKLVEEISAKDLKDKCKHHLLVKVDDAKKAAIILEKNLGYNSYEILENERIKIYKGLDEPQLVNKLLVEGNVGVYSLEKVSENLEEYFINLIGGDINV